MERYDVPTLPPAWWINRAQANAVDITNTIKREAEEERTWRAFRKRMQCTEIIHQTVLKTIREDDEWIII